MDNPYAPRATRREVLAGTVAAVAVGATRYLWPDVPAAPAPTPAPPNAQTEPVPHTTPRRVNQGLLRSSARLLASAEPTEGLAGRRDTGLPRELREAIRVAAPLTGLNQGQGEVLLAIWALQESGGENLPGLDDEPRGYFQFRPRGIRLLNDAAQAFGQSPLIETVDDLRDPFKVTRAVALLYAHSVLECDRPYVSSIQRAARSASPDPYVNRAQRLVGDGWIQGLDMTMTMSGPNAGICGPN